MSDQTVTLANFDQEVINYPGQVIVDFSAAWCGPCQMLSPIIDEIAAEMKDQVKVVKIDVDSQQELAGKYGVSAVPTIIIFDHGKVKNTIVGFHQKDSYLAALK